jgi:hypothetical protein
MKKRISSIEEINLVVKTIVETVEKDSVGLHEYSKDELIDDYVLIKESITCVTIETPHGYKIINALSLEDKDDRYETFQYVFIIFGEDKIYLYEGDFIDKDMTEEKYVEGLKIEGDLVKLQQEVELAKMMLMRSDSTINNSLLINQYKDACDKLNRFFDEFSK